MPKRIEHKWLNEKELKWCAGCKGFMELDKFHTTNGRTWDGLFYICRDCYNRKRDTSPRNNALRAWRHLNDRVKNDERYIKKGIQVLVEKEEFISWYCDNWFKGCMVDRIDNTGHYELSNIQLISQFEHNEKARVDRLALLGVVEQEGFRYCYGCEEVKRTEEFYRKARKVSKANPLGLDEKCKSCALKSRKQRYSETGK